MITRFWLIRHGEPVHAIRGRCYGALDIELSAEGRDQMERIAAHLKAEPMDVIYTSPKLRALESARILASCQQCGWREEPGLQEIDFGDFEGLTYDEIAARDPALYRRWMESPSEVQFPNGESFIDVQKRVLRTFDAIRETHQGQTVALVTHAGVIRVLIAWALQMPDAYLFRLAQDYAASSLLTLIDGVPVVQLLNHRLP